MRKVTLTALLSLVIAISFAQTTQQPPRPCAVDPVYREFDFWIGEWDVFGKNGQKGGDSKISLILDSCIILEEWTGTSGYTGKSYNTYNRTTKQWQQTWVDNKGGSTEFLRGHGEKDKIVFYADKVLAPDGKSFMRRLTFYRLSDDKVRQHGERSDDGGKEWTTEYDLEYRRKK